MELHGDERAVSEERLYLTGEVAPIPCTVRARRSDFAVEELPLYEPSGRGTHVHFRLEKAGLSTAQALRALARRLELPAGRFSAAGLKDARAVTVQKVSVEGVAPERLEGLRLPGLSTSDARRHETKLRTGHLAGNRFRLRLRELPPSRRADLESVLSQLERRGVPNVFGEQRFGRRGDTWRVGRALLQGDPHEAAQRLCGAPSEADTQPLRRARELFEGGRWEEAACLWPRGDESARLARALARTEGDAARAWEEVPRSFRLFCVSAYQSRLFNAILARRMPFPDRLVEGDWARFVTSGSGFEVEDLACEAPRAERFEISPTAPLFGRRVGLARGQAGRIESAVLAEEGIDPQLFARGALASRGDRRPLRVRLGELALADGADEHGEWLELRFALPPGSYATAVLREIHKA